MSGDKGGSRADTLVKVVLVFLISLLSFMVGTFAGKQVSDSEHRRMALEGEYKGEHQAASEDATAEDGAEKISEQEVASLTEEFVNKEKSTREPASDEEASGEEHKEEHKAADAHSGEGYKEYKRAEKPAEKGAEKADEHKAEHKAEAHAAPAAAAHAPAHGTPKDGTHKVAAKVAEGKAPTDGKKEEAKAAPTLPSVASGAVGKYTVQVGAFADENEAKNQAAQLKGKGWTAFYLPAQVNGKTWYRVTVGLFNNYKAAQDFRTQFIKESNIKTALVQKIVQ